MLNIINNFSEAKNSNLVVLLKSRLDFDKYNFLNFERNILDKVEKNFQEQKNTILNVFFWNENFEEITFLFHLDEEKDINIFLWESISKLKDNLTFEYKRDNLLLDHLILWKYDYSEFKTDKKSLELNIVCDEILNIFLEERINTLTNITNIRDLVNKPSNEKTPEKYLKIIKNISFKNTKVKVIEYDDIKKLWLNLLEAVWRASNSKPKLIILERITDKKFPTYGFVWKWITFDTGWLNIKTEDHMYWMKSDMAWSATLLYMMKELDDKKIDCNIVCALAIAENSISGDAYRPWDILTWYNWKTVEITNTDAEWRLVLADWISYISDNYELESITTIATLTWACIAALWYNYAWIMWNNKDFIKFLLNNETFEKYWELPLDENLLQKTKWDISDLKNWTSWVMAWSSMWWAFLKNFCMKNEKFTHIDIAGPSYVNEKFWLYNKWATWFWLDSLSKAIIEYNKFRETNV